MMNILDYLVGNTDRHWENWGLLVDNETNQPIRLHDLMDFNRAFQQYDTLEGANCLTVGKRHLSQKAAAEEAVRKVGLNQIDELDDTAFAAHPEWGEALKKRLDILKTAASGRFGIEYCYIIRKPSAGCQIIIGGHADGFCDLAYYRAIPPCPPWRQPLFAAGQDHSGTSACGRMDL